MDTREEPARALPAVLALVAIVLALSVVGFYPSYIRHLPGFDGVGWQVHVHLLTVLAWLAMLVAQAWLAATGRFAQHRAVGRLSFVLVPLVLVGFALITSYGQLRHKQPALLGAAFIDGAMFITLYALAIRHRRTPGYHARYMMLTVVSFLNPTLGRAVAPEVSVPVELLVFVGLAIAARRKGVPARPYAVAAAVYVVVTTVVIAVSVVEPSIMEALWNLLWGPTSPADA